MVFFEWAVDDIHRQLHMYTYVWIITLIVCRILYAHNTYLYCCVIWIWCIVIGSWAHSSNLCDTNAFSWERAHSTVASYKARTVFIIVSRGRKPVCCLSLLFALSYRICYNAFVAVKTHINLNAYCVWRLVWTYMTVVSGTVSFRFSLDSDWFAVYFA